MDNKPKLKCSMNKNKNSSSTKSTIESIYFNKLNLHQQLINHHLSRKDKTEQQESDVLNQSKQLDAKEIENVLINNQDQQIDDEEQVSIVIRAINEKLCSPNQANQSLENDQRKGSDSFSHSSSLVSTIRKRFSMIKKRSKSNLPPCLIPNVKVESKWKVNFPPRVTLTSSNHICNLSSKFHQANLPINNTSSSLLSQACDKTVDCVNEPRNQTKENIKPIHSIRKLNNADYVRIVMNRDQLIEFRKSALKIFENNKQVFEKFTMRNQFL